MSRRAAKGQQGLVVLRMSFVNFVTSLVGAGVVLGIVAARSTFMKRPLPGMPVGLAILVLGIASLEATRRLEQPLDCTIAARLAASYRSRFFVGVAFSESLALIGFVAVMLTSQVWPYPLALVFTAVGFWRLAPTRANLARDQEILDQSGCQLSLVAALGTPPTGRR